MTTRVALTDTAWKDLGLAPLFLQSVRFGSLNQPGDVFFVIADTMPDTLSESAHELTVFPSKLDADVGLSRHVYARAADDRGALVAVSR